jgi:autotransporter-associated beta strand protein
MKYSSVRQFISSSVHQLISSPALISLLLVLPVLSSAQVANSWNGSASNDWNNGSNWSAGIPDATHNVTIPAGMPRYPVIGAANGICRQLLLMENGTSITGTGALTISDDAGIGDVTGTALISCPVALSATPYIYVTGNLTISGVVSGVSNDWVKTGPGTLLLSGLNTFTGQTLIFDGTLSINTLRNIGGLGNASSLGFPTTLGNGTILMKGTATLQFTGVAQVSDRPIELYQTDGATLEAWGSSSTTLTGGVNANGLDLVLTGTGNGYINSTIATNTGAVTKNGTGTWTLSGTNTFTGGTTLNAGTLNINNSQALGTAAGTFTINTGTIDNTSGSPITTVDCPMVWNAGYYFTGANSLNLGSGPVTLNADAVVTVNGSTLTVGGTINAPGYNLSKSGVGTFALGSGDVSVKDLRISGGTFVATSGTMSLYGNFNYSNGVFTHNNGTLIFAGNSTQNITGQATVFNNLTIAGTSSTTTGIEITVAGNLLVGGSRLSVGTGSPGAGLTVSGTTTVNSSLWLWSLYTKTFTGNVTINPGASWEEYNSTPVSFGGSLQNDGTYSGNGGVHTFTGTGAVTAGANSISMSYLTVNGTLTNNLYLVVSNSLAGSGTFTNGAGSTLYYAGSSIGAGLVATAPGNTVFYAQSGNQVVKPVAYENVILGFSGVKTTTGVTVNGILSVEGSATASDAMTYGPAATLQYKGMSAQTTGVEFPSTFSGSGGVIIDKTTNPVTLDANKTVTSGLNLKSGVLATTAAYSLTSATVTRTSGHVKGNLALPVSAGSPVQTFCIGDGSNYTPVSVSFSGISVPGTLTASTTGGQHPDFATSGLSATKYLNRYWTLTKDAPLAFGTCDATFTFVPGDIMGSADPGSMIIRKWNSSAWSSPVMGAQDPLSTTVTGLTSFSDFAEGIYEIPTTTSAGSKSLCAGTTSVDLTAAVSPNPGGGNVEFFVDGISAGTNAPDALTGTATLPYDPHLLTAGDHPVIAVFSGYGIYLAGTSDPGSNGIVKVNPLPLFSVTPGDVTCHAGSNGTIRVNATTGTGPWHYSTNNGTDYTFDPLNPHTFTGLLPATYHVRVMDSNGCESATCP